jgi:membrane-associated phospholipid phosphatase
VHGSSVFNALLRFVYRSDKPYNDFPSIHASSGAIFALYLYFTRNRW